MRMSIVVIAFALLSVVGTGCGTSPRSKSSAATGSKKQAATPVETKAEAAKPDMMAKEAAPEAAPVVEAEQPKPAAPVVKKAEPAPVVKPAERKSKRNEAMTVTAAVPSQPDAGALPGVVDANTNAEQLAAHALLVAREQVAADQAGGVTVLERQAFLVQAWTPMMQARQSELAQIRAERDARAQREANQAATFAAHEGKINAVEVEYAGKAEAERRKTAPILPE